MSTAYTRRRVAGGEMALSCCALTKDGKHAVAGEEDKYSLPPEVCVGVGVLGWF